VGVGLKASSVTSCQIRGLGKTTAVPGAKSGAVDARGPAADEDLMFVAAAWPDLPQELRQRIVGMVQAAATLENEP
jgi:hypothetical protein